MSVTTPTPTTVTFGNPSPQIQGFDDPDFVTLALSTDNDRMLSMIACPLSTADQIYAVGVYEMEQIVAVSEVA